MDRSEDEKGYGSDCASFWLSRPLAPVANVRKTWTPALRRDEETVLLIVGLAMGQNAMGGSAVAQVFYQIGNEASEVRDEDLIKDYFGAIE